MLSNRVMPLFPLPVLMIKASKKILVVTDLHIGWEKSWSDRGIFIPSQAHKLEAKILQIIKEYDPDRLVVLGDVKQAIAKVSMEEWRSIPHFFDVLQKHVEDIVVILGNHDGDLEPLTPSSVQIVPSSGLTIGDSPRIGLFHGHAWPSPEVLSAEILIMGHIHPVIWFRDKLGLWTVRQVWVKTKCSGEKLARAYLKSLNIKKRRNPQVVYKEKTGFQIDESKLLILPAFNDLIGGVSVNRIEKRLMGPILRSEGVDLETGEVYLLDGTYLGTIHQLQKYLARNI